MTKPPGNSPAPIFKPRPFKPHPWLLMVAAVVMVGWIGFLVMLYFETVHGHSQQAPVYSTESSK